MKSTGLFGKNSGRVGGVVYANYRGEQIVRAYQPKVSNPNTSKQVAQRAKFKLVSQVGASLAREINLSFIPNDAKQSPRNAFVKEMLKKAMYERNTATLPIEEIVLTNSRTAGIGNLQASSNRINGVITGNFTKQARVSAVFIGYSSGGEITLLGRTDFQVEDFDGQLIFGGTPIMPQGYTNIRALVYAYEPKTDAGTTYEDYEVLEDDATLQDVLKVYSGAVMFSETANVLVPQNV